MGGKFTEKGKEKLIFKKDFIYLFMRDTHTERQKHRQREKQAPCRESHIRLPAWGLLLPLSLSLSLPLPASHE